MIVLSDAFLQQYSKAGAGIKTSTARKGAIPEVKKTTNNSPQDNWTQAAANVKFNSQSQRDVGNGKVSATEIRSLDKRKWVLENLMTTLNIIENIWFWHQYVLKKLHFCLFRHFLGHFTNLLRSNVYYNDDLIKQQRSHFSKDIAEQPSPSINHRFMFPQTSVGLNHKLKGTIEADGL